MKKLESQLRELLTQESDRNFGTGKATIIKWQPKEQRFVLGKRLPVGHKDLFGEIKAGDYDTSRNFLPFELRDMPSAELKEKIQKWGIYSGRANRALADFDERLEK